MPFNYRVRISLLVLFAALLAIVSSGQTSPPDVCLDELEELRANPDLILAKVNLNDTIDCYGKESERGYVGCHQQVPSQGALDNFTAACTDAGGKYEQVLKDIVCEGWTWNIVRNYCVGVTCVEDDVAEMANVEIVDDAQKLESDLGSYEGFDWFICKVDGALVSPLSSSPLSSSGCLVRGLSASVWIILIGFISI
jgi:hypothetical protein